MAHAREKQADKFTHRRCFRQTTPGLASNRISDIRLKIPGAIPILLLEAIEFISLHL